MPAKTKVSVKTQVKPKVTVSATNKVVETASQNSDVSSQSPQKVDVKVKRTRPRNRPFAEIHEDFTEKLRLAYTNLQAVHRSFSTLNTAHKREVTSNRTHRTSNNRTPTTLFDQQLVDYFLSRLSGDELKITRKNGDSSEEVDLSSLSTDTPLYRTDLTQLYTRAFIKHNLVDGDDHRKITGYAKDEALVNLLTSSDNDELKEARDQLNSGKYELDIFNIQKFFTHHLRKLEREQETSA